MLCFLLASLLLGAGCHSTPESPKPAFAAVTLHGNTPGQIAEATEEVFRGHSYLLVDTAPRRLTFEKPASKMSNFAYGNWIGDSPVWTRVKVAIVPVGEATFSLQCQAWLLRDRGGATEEEMKVGKLHHGAYQKLLEEVAARLAQRPLRP